MTQQPSQFRKKPVTVQAVQYPCAHPALRRCDCDGNSACSSCGLEYIETLEGCMNVSPGDWIITGVQGELYPCKPDIFAATYEAAPTPPASAQDDAKDDFGMSPYCPECNGGGRISVLSDNSPDAHDVDIDCTHCDGSGSAAYAAANLAKALQSERMQHLQMYGEYKNFHRSLCARFGYGHDEVHFRRDLVSLEEAIAAKVSAPAAGDARMPALNIEAAAKAMAECMDYPWAHMPEQGRATMREHAQTVIRAASQQQEG